MTEIAVIDYGIGNIRSICNAFEGVGANVRLTNDFQSIRSANGVVLPGVGAFWHGMEQLKRYELDKVLKDVCSSGTPLLGICLGMQLLFSSSSEFGETRGLNIIPGKVCQLSPPAEKTVKLPNVGWSEIYAPTDKSWSGSILNNLKDAEYMYFVHSYFCNPKDRSHVLSITDYAGHKYCSAVKAENVYGCQFHPEKSADAGLSIINNFKNICE